MFIDTMEKVKINDSEQYISIRGEKKDSPLLLYLHGGPGDAALPLMLKYNKALESAYTVVVWEQRGAGKSYYKFAEDENITIDLFVEDTKQLTFYLLKRFSQEKIFLVGHSWGSVLGLKFIQKYPQFVDTYIACGQVVNMKKSSQIAFDYAMNKNIEANNQKIADKLKNISPTYNQKTWLNDLLFVTKQVVKHKGSLYGKTNYNMFVWDFINSKKYNVLDLINRERGSLQSIKRLWQELMTIDFESVTSYDVPIIFVEGREDYHVSSQLAESYFKTIISQKTFHWFEKSAHFPQWSESNRFNKILIALVS